MRKTRWLGLILLASCGCSTMNNTERGALTGGILGTAAGTMVGLATGNPRTGAVVGGLAGTGVGALVGNAEDKAEARQVKAVQEYVASNPPVSIPDVIKMTHDHVGDDLIIQQIQATNSYYNLSPTDITQLRQQGVSQRVVSVMIARRAPGPMVMQPRPSHVYVVDPPPPPVSVGIGFGVTNCGPRRRCW